MFAWKYLLQICQKDHIPCSVCSLEETYSLIWFPAFIFLKGTNYNYCLLWSVIFSTDNPPKETSASQMRCDSRQYASIFCIHTWVARAGTGSDCPASQCSPKRPRSLLRSVSWLLGVFCSIFWCFKVLFALTQYLCASRRACAHASYQTFLCLLGGA